MSSTKRSTIVELSHADDMELLKRNSVGRLAYAFGGRVDIEPLSYVVDGDWLYGRTSPGAKLAVVEHSRWAAFETDEIEDRFNWRSVVVHGAIYLLDQTNGDPARAEYARAVEVIQSLDHDAFTDDDPAPHRTQLFRMHIDEIAGRSSSRG